MLKVRSDSPFAVLTKKDQEVFLDWAAYLSIEDMSVKVEVNYPDLNFSIEALKRYVRRLKEAALREDAEDASESMEGLAKTAAGGKARDGALEAMRQKLYDAAMEKEDTDAARDLFALLKEERREQMMLELEARRVALEEEKARQACRRLELEGARSGMKLLPKLAEILLVEGGGSAEEVLARARRVLGAEGALLLTEKGGG